MRERGFCGVLHWWRLGLGLGFGEEGERKSVGNMFVFLVLCGVWRVRKRE